MLSFPRFGAVLVNLPEVQRGHRTFLAENERMLEQASQTAGVHAKDHVMRYPGFQPRTMHLQRSTTVRVQRLSSGRLLRLDNTATYADPIDGGARPHVIEPRRAKVLRFVTRDGTVVFAKRVNHPGNRPYKFMYRAWHSAGRVEEQFLRRTMAQLARKF